MIENIITRAIGAKEKLEIDFFEYRLKKGDMIFSGFSVTLCILFFIWLLFGDVSGLTNMDFEGYMKWVEEHTSLIVILMTVFPIVTGIIYYLSYRITAGIFVRKERDIDE